MQLKKRNHKNKLSVKYIIPLNMFFYQIHEFQERLYDIIVYGTSLIYIALIIGLINDKPKYLTIINDYLPIYISLFLILRFNPYRHVKFTELDRKIAFAAGFFILTTSIINNVVLEYYTKEIKHFLGYKTSN